MNEVLAAGAPPVWMLMMNGGLLVVLLSCFYWLAISARRQRAIERELQGMQAQLRSSVDCLERQLTAVPLMVDPSPDEPAMRVFTELQSTGRAKIVKFNRMGKTPDEISALVGMPASTVRLLQRVQAMESPAAAVPGRKAKTAANSPLQSRISIDRE